MRRELLLLALGTVVLLAIVVPPWPCDWDGVGFVRAVTRFDLARMEPHPPGYPIYVLASRALALVIGDAALACGLASALGAALVVAAIAAELPSGKRALALLSLASPVWITTATMARADALGLGLAASAVAVGVRALDPAHALTAGALLGLSLGTRPSGAVLVLTLWMVGAWRWRHRRDALACGTVALVCVSIAWGIGLVAASGGAARYLTLARAQWNGHFNTWGGSVWTAPDPVQRLRGVVSDLARAFAYTHGASGVARVCGGCLLLAAGRRAWPIVALTVPAFVAAFVLQNVGHEARHVLPTVLALLAVACHGAARLLEERRVPRALLFVGLACFAWPTVHEAIDARQNPPAGVLIGRYVRARGDAVLFGGRASRLAEWAGAVSVPRTLVGEVDVTLERFDHLPREVFLTSEVEQRGRGRWRATWVRTFCGPRGCVSLYRYGPSVLDD